MNRYLGTILAASLAAAALTLAGCSSTQSEPTFSTDEADGLALKMIPEASVLPGTGWKLLSENDFSDTDDEDSSLPLDGNEHCDLVNETFAALDEFDDKERKGRAERIFEVGGDGTEPVEVEITADVYESASRLRVAAQQYDRIFAESALGQCMVAFLESAETESTSVDAVDHVPSAVSPRRGWELAVGWDITHAEGAETEYFESYSWRIGNAMVSVTLSGPKERLTDKFVESILQRVDGAAIVAAKGS